MIELAASAPAAATPPVRRRIYTGVRMSMWAWRQRVRARMLAFASSELPKGKVRRDWKNKAHAFAGCGRTVSSLACNGCQNINVHSGTIVATCGLRICPICARRKAQRLRFKLRKAWDAGGRGRKDSLYFLTFTMRYDPTDASEVSAEGLLRRKAELLTAWGSVWRQYLKKRAHAACRAIEVGGSGMVHLHVLYAGRRPDVEELRARWLLHCEDSPIVNVRHCKDPGHAIVELAKYVTKGASPAKLDIVSGTAGAFMDPDLAVAVEIAFSGDRLVQCYGAWLGISVDDDEETPEEEASARELHRAPCPHCGVVGEWHAAPNYTLEEWFERFGSQLDHWRPRIGGSGPRKKPQREDEHEQRDWNGNAAVPGRAERARAAAAVNADPGAGKRDAARAGRPGWTATAPRLGGEG